MDRCTAQKGMAKSKFAEKSELAEERLKSLPYESKEDLYYVIFANGNGRYITITGCKNLVKEKEEAVYVLGKVGDRCIVVIGNESKEMTCEELSKVLAGNKVEHNDVSKEDEELDR